MRSPRKETITISSSPDAVFDAALGVAQDSKNVRILAVHNEGRKLVVREKSMMSNPKFFQVWVQAGDGGQSQLHVVVGTDPRSQKALMDGKANDKSLKKFVESVQASVAGSAPAPTSPVANHYVQKKSEVPWADADQAPEIELDGNFLAVFNL